MEQRAGLQISIMSFGLHNDFQGLVVVAIYGRGAGAVLLVQWWSLLCKGYCGVRELVQVRLCMSMERCSFWFFEEEQDFRAM